jgi:2',3'-cyclic-nucleotide 2'-phosphodiesterase (5'-nucleotidase family)
LKTNYPSTPLVLLDTGNFSDNPSELGDLRTATLLQAMKRMGYKAVNVGERDMAMGYDDFVKRTEKLGITFISTNIVKQGTKEPIFPPSTVVEVKGTDGKTVRVGVLGVDRYSPVWQKAGPAGINLGMATPADMIATYLPPLRAKSDLVVLLAGITKEDAHDLAKRFPDIDLIVGAYGGVFNTVEESEGKTGVYYTGNQGKRIGETRVTFDPATRTPAMISYLHFLTVHYPEDKSMQDSIAGVLAKMPKPDEPKKADGQQKPPSEPAAAGGH